MKNVVVDFLSALAWTLVIFLVQLKLSRATHISYSLIDYLDVRSRSLISVHLEPMHGPRKLEVVDIQSKQVTVRWEPLGYNVTRCHSYNLTVQYRSRVGGNEQTREEVCYDTQSRDPQHTIHNLTPFTNLSVKLVLRNPEGVMESNELEVQTDEDGECDETDIWVVGLK